MDLGFGVKGFGLRDVREGDGHHVGRVDQREALPRRFHLPHCIYQSTMT